MAKEKKSIDYYAEEFMAMPDKVKELYARTIYSLVCDKEFSKLEILVKVLNFPMECESPIEQILLFCLNVYEIVYDYHFIYFYAQEEVIANGNNYRIDIFFDDDLCGRCSGYKLAIECDGHEFHKATKEQVARDNERDFNLKKAGYEVIHFSGSQLYKEPYECAERVFDYIRGKANGNL